MKYIVTTKNFRNGETYCACTLIIKKNFIVLNNGVKCLDQNIDTYFKIDRNVCPNHINLSNDLEKKKICTTHFWKLRLSSLASLKNYTRQDQEHLFDLKWNWIDYENSMWYMYIKISVYFNGCHVTLLKEIHRNTN